MIIKRIAFIAPSSCLAPHERQVLNRTARRLKRSLGAEDLFFSPHLFSSDAEIDHVTAPVEARAGVFKMAIREFDLVISIAGGTGAEDILRKLDKKDFGVIRERRPLFIGFSDFTFLLNEIYHLCRVPVIYFPSLKLGKGNLRKMLSLIAGDEVRYRGSAWLTPPPARRLSGIPIGGTSPPSSISSTAASRPSSAGNAISCSSRTSRSTWRTSTACSRPSGGIAFSKGSKGWSSAP